jgi:hypothetical protein
MRILSLLVCLLFTINLFAGVGGYGYTYIPKKLYPNQVFPVTILVKDAKIIRATVTLKNRDSSEIEIINSKPLKNSSSNDTFYTFYFKAGDKNLKVPDFWIESDFTSSTLKGVSIPVEKLNIPKEINFSGVIALGFKIKNHKTSKYKKNKILNITLEAYEANLEDFYIPNIKKKRLNRFKREGSTVIANYSFTISQDSDIIKLYYFNTIKEKFIPVEIDTNLKSGRSRERRELKPKDSSFTKLKKYTFGVLSIFFIAMFLLYKDYFYLALLVVTLVIFLTFFVPLKKVCVESGSNIYILPIKNSTVSKVTEERGEFSVYNRYRNYYKIEYKNGVIGWVRDESLCED